VPQKSTHASLAQKQTDIGLTGDGHDLDISKMQCLRVRAAERAIRASDVL
tara:strand:+ start:1487 stop:1636 length:150 start_codon:yes stop_codon:yes gene_type:complete